MESLNTGKLESRTINSALFGNPNALEEVANVLSEEDLHVFKYLKELCEKEPPGEELLQNLDIWSTAVRFASKYNWLEVPLEEMGEKRNSLYCIAKLNQCLELLSENRLEQARQIATKVVSIAKSELYKDEAENILSYIYILEGDSEKAADLMLNALNNEYTPGLAKNALYLAAHLPDEERKLYISRVLDKAPSRDLREKVFYMHFASMMKSLNQSEILGESVDLYELVDSELLEHAKEMFIEGCSLKELQMLVKIISKKDIGFLHSVAAIDSLIWDTVECQFLISKELGLEELISFVSSYKSSIKQSEWVKGELLDFVVMFADAAISEENNKIGIIGYNFLDKISEDVLGKSEFRNVLVRLAPTATAPNPNGIIKKEAVTDFAMAFKYLIDYPEYRESIGAYNISEDEFLGVMQKIFLTNIIKGIAIQFQNLTNALPNPGYRNTAINREISELKSYLTILESMPLLEQAREHSILIKELYKGLI